MRSWLPSPSSREFSQLGWLPRVVFGAGGLLLVFAFARAMLTFRHGGSVWVAVLDFAFMGAPAVALMYTGQWMPESEISREYYPRIIAWVLGGIAVMYGFIALRDLHPGVSAEWSIGTQAIALTIGSIGGLVIGVQETKASIRTEQLEAHQRELQRQNEQLERFARVVSHDLRNPLSVASGRLELAADERESAHLDAVKQALERMQALIDDLLTLARQGTTVADLEPIDLSALANRSWETVDTGEATLESRTSRSVEADGSQVKQLFENLFRNAVEHGGQAVTVTVGDLEDGFYVEDDGPGIAAGERDEVFEVGYSTSREGTGFGLSIVKQVADTHGWTIHATEGSEGGARFEITDVEFATR